MIPLALDLLKVASIELTRAPDQTHPPAQVSTNESPQPSVSKAENIPVNQSRQTTAIATQSTKAMSKGPGGWHAGKPAWRPPGRTRI